MQGVLLAQSKSPEEGSCSGKDCRGKQQEQKQNQKDQNTSRSRLRSPKPQARYLTGTVKLDGDEAAMMEMAERYLVN